MSSNQASKQRLQFKQNLTKDAKLTITELIKRLHALHNELSKLDQELVDTDSLSTIRKDLIHASLLVHKDKSVKALVACCLADLLRLYAPDAPYTRPELRDILEFFLYQLRNLSPSNNQAPNQPQYIYLLDSLATVQSIVLICEVPDSDALMTGVFKLFFSVVSTEMAKNIPLMFADLLSQIVNQTPSFVPMPVLKCILAQFQPKNSKSNPAAYRLAVDVCNACEDKLQRDVCRYFTEVMILGSKNARSRNNDTDDEDEDSADECQGAIKQIADTHELIKNIYKACPGLLLNVIPHLQDELESPQEDVRLLSTQTLGSMFAEQSSSGAVMASNSTLVGSSAHRGVVLAGNDLARRYHSTWKVWLAKSQDISPQIRITVIKSCKSILAQYPYLKVDINRVLLMKLKDPDEKVRFECCKCFTELDFDLVLHHIQTNVLKDLGERVQDRKPSVQQEALKALGRLYELAYPEIEDNEREYIAHFAWIAAVVLSAMFVGDQRLCATAEKCFLDHIAPLPKSIADEAAWVDRLITISRHLGIPDFKRLKQLTRIATKQPTIFVRFLESCEAYNGGIIDHNERQVKTQLARTIEFLSSKFPDASKAMDELQKFAKLNDRRLCKILRVLSDPQTELKLLIKTYQEFNRKVEALSTPLAETIGFFLRKSGYLVLNSASVPTLLCRLENPSTIQTSDAMDEDEPESSTSTRITAKKLIDMVSISCPVMLTTHVDILTKAFFDASESSANKLLIDACLLGMSQLAKTKPDVIPSDPRLDEELTRFALSGTAEQVKYAATILAVVPDKAATCREVNVQLAQTLKHAEPGRLVSNLAGLARIAKHAPSIFDAHSQTVAAFIIQALLMKSSEGEQEGDDDWVKDEELCDLAKARVLGLKVLTNRCIAYADTKAAQKLSAPIFKLLWEILKNEGQVSTTTHSPAVAMRLRLKAAQSILKLATCKAFSNDIDTNFETLAWMAEDEKGEVREGFINKLVKYLQTNRLINPRFNVILFLVAHDPEPVRIEYARNCVQSRARVAPQQIRTAMFESIIVRLLHLLAHHPNFSLDVQDLRITSKYIEFYMDCVANNENVSLLYYLAGQLKTVRDAESQNDSEHLYAISELAQLVIRTRAKIHHWALPTYPGQAIMPTDIFRPIPTTEIAHQIAKRTFLSQEVSDELEKRMLSKKDRTTTLVNHEAKKVRVVSPTTTITASTSKTTTTTNQSKKAKTIRKRKSSPADDDSQPEIKKEKLTHARRTGRKTQKTTEVDSETEADENTSLG